MFFIRYFIGLIVTIILSCAGGLLCIRAGLPWLGPIVAVFMGVAMAQVFYKR